MPVDESDIEALEAILKNHDASEAFFVTKRGESLTLCSGERAKPEPRARFTFVQRNTWGLSLPHHTGRWQRTPIAGAMDDVFSTLVRDFGFYLST